MSPLEATQGRRYGAVLPPEPSRAVQPGLLQDDYRGDASFGAFAFESFDGSGHDWHCDALMQVSSSAFMRVDNLHASLRQCASMKSSAAASEIRSWLKDTLAQTPSLTIKSWASDAGVAPSTIHRALKDDYEFVTSTNTLNKLAAAAGRPAPNMTQGSPLRPEPTELSLIGPIQAGAWLMVDDTPQDEPTFFTAILDRRYPHASQWLREVKGDSMNARGIAPGDIAHLVDLVGSGVNLNTGMIVEVTRTRDGGGLREITLKEVEVTPQGLVLWPRSTNARWRDPVRLTDGVNDNSDVEVQITGLLLQSMKRFV